MWQANKHTYPKLFNDRTIREVQITPQGALTTHTHTLEQLKSKTVTASNAGKDVERLGQSYITGKYKLIQAFWRIV